MKLYNIFKCMCSHYAVKNDVQVDIRVLAKPVLPVEETVVEETVVEETVVEETISLQVDNPGNDDEISVVIYYHSSDDEVNIPSELDDNNSSPYYEEMNEKMF